MTAAASDVIAIVVVVDAVLVRSESSFLLNYMMITYCWLVPLLCLVGDTHP